MTTLRRIRVIDSHTEGEPTRVVVAGMPPLLSDSLPKMVDELREKHDYVRTGTICEPRGHEAIVGAFLLDPISEGAAASVIFYNNVGYLGMCGHGTIGLVRTLQYLGKIGVGEVRLDTPVGPVAATLHSNGTVSVRNVPSYRYRKDVPVEVPGYGTVVGDIAYGGNWFFLTSTDIELHLSHLPELTAFSSAIRRELDRQGITGESGGHIDHVELFGAPSRQGSHSRNFVLCPGLAYDRSPCGTGTSAKLACLAADGKLQPGAVWRQESVIGSVFEGRFDWDGDRILPEITGSAFICADSELIYDSADPFVNGIGQ